MRPIQECTQPHVEGVCVVRKEHGAINDGGLQASVSVGEQREWGNVTVSITSRFLFNSLQLGPGLSPTGPMKVTSMLPEPAIPSPSSFYLTSRQHLTQMTDIHSLHFMSLLLYYRLSSTSLVTPSQPHSRWRTCPQGHWCVCPVSPPHAPAQVKAQWWLAGGWY